MPKIKLRGLIAAPHTPLRPDGSVNIDQIPTLCSHLIQAGVSGVFLNGTTGECHSLSLDERRRVAEAWSATLAGTPLQWIVHVGSNCIEDAKSLAGHAEKIGAHAIAALAPSYFKPATVPQLVTWCQAIARSAPSLPFYYYDIPSLTGVALPMAEFLTQAREAIPSLAGLKFTNMDVMQLGECLRMHGADLDVLFGCDEAFLSGLVLGVRGAVGSTYNFAAALYLRLLEAFQAGDLDRARLEQDRSVTLIRLLFSYGLSPSAKAVMSMVGVDCGPPRLPLLPLSLTQTEKLRRDLEGIGFFKWSR